MRILNCMWSAEPAFKSVHLVHSSFIAAVAPEYQANLFLMGDAHQQNLLTHAESFHSSKKATRKIIQAFFLRRRWLAKIQQCQPDVVILDGLGMARLLLPVVEKYNQTKVLVYFHGQTSFNAQDVCLFSKKYTFSLKIIAVSKMLAEQIKSELPQLEVLAIPTYLNLPSAPRQYNDSSKDVVFGAVGRLVKEKNFSILIDCIAQLINKKHKVKLVVAGEGRLRNLFEKRIKELELSEYVSVLGYLSDTNDFYKGIDILLVPSLQEGQGLVVQEALHYGKPIICSDLLVFKEQLGNTGVYCSTNNVEQWAQACIEHLPQARRLLLLESQQSKYHKYNNVEMFRQRCIAACY